MSKPPQVNFNLTIYEDQELKRLAALYPASTITRLARAAFKLGLDCLPTHLEKVGEAGLPPGKHPRLTVPKNPLVTRPKEQIDFTSPEYQAQATKAAEAMLKENKEANTVDEWHAMLDAIG